MMTVCANGGGQIHERADLLELARGVLDGSAPGKGAYFPISSQY